MWRGRCGLALVLVALLCAVGSAQNDDEVCAQVTIQIDQTATLVRTAFRATLGIDNATADVLEDVLVVIDITDSMGQPANHLFGIPAPALTGIANVSGTGDVFPGLKATAQWDILPSEEAVPGPDPISYRVGGMFSYSLAGEFIEIELFPVAIEVHPIPKLVLNYFLQQRVYGDNPFTPDNVEESEPFSLALLIRNTGYGAAKSLEFTTQEPQVKNNEQGLFAVLSLIGAELNGVPTLSQYDVPVGDLAPGDSAVLRWKMTSNLKGEFVDATATLKHVGSTGDVDVSLIDEDVSISHMLHHLIYRPDAPEGGVPSFLIVDDTASSLIDPLTEDALPNLAWLPDATTEPVATRLDFLDPQQTIGPASVTKSPSSMDLTGEVTVTVDATGWSYARFQDPGGAAFELVQVVRRSPSGARKSISVAEVGDVGNAWSTERCETMAAPPGDIFTQRLLHIVDDCDEIGDYVYDLTFDPVPVLPLTANTNVLHLITGGVQILSIDLGLDHANDMFLILGSEATSPSSFVDSVEIPLVFDTYFDALLRSAPSLGLIGSLDGAGRKDVPLTLPPGLPVAGLAGRTLYHAAVTLENGVTVTGSTNPVSVYLAP